MEPFRAFVADKLNPDQRTVGFVMQSFFIGIGASLANALPYIFRFLGVTGRTPSGIPFTVQYSFKIGAVAFLLAVLWTVDVRPRAVLQHKAVPRKWSVGEHPDYLDQD